MAAEPDTLALGNGDDEMSDFSDCIDYVDRVKVEFHSRFRHMLEAIAALEDRIRVLEAER